MDSTNSKSSDVRSNRSSKMDDFEQRFLEMAYGKVLTDEELAIYHQGGAILVSIDPARESGNQVVVTVVSLNDLYGTKAECIIVDDLSNSIDEIGEMVFGEKAISSFNEPRIRNYLSAGYLGRREYDVKLDYVPIISGTGKRQFQESDREILARQRRESMRKGRR